MSNTNMQDFQDKSSDEKIGAYLRRAREAAHISTTDLAREIRIAPEMLEHLESGQYDKLPVDAYVRGYLNSICNRLDLDRNKVLDWYSQEVQRERGGNVRSLTTLDIGNPASSETSSHKTLPIILVVLAIAFFAVMHIIRKETPESITPTADSAALATSPSEEDSVPSDSLLASLGAEPADTATTATDSAKTSASADDEDDSTNTAAGETVLKFECFKDSTYIQVRRVGDLTWARILRATDKPRFVSHTDTMKVSVGSPEKTRLFINNERVRFNKPFFKVYQGQIVP